MGLKAPLFAPVSGVVSRMPEAADRLEQDMVKATNSGALSGLYDAILFVAVLGFSAVALLALALAAPLVKPGGRLVFATCSLLPEEGEGQLVAALQRDTGLRVERVELQGVEPE